MVGDLGALDVRLTALVGAAQAKLEQAGAARAAARAAAAAAKEKLVLEAEELSQSSQWKATGDRFRAIVEEWKAIRGVDRKADEQLWKRFAAARDTFTRRRGSHFAALDEQRGVARARKEELVAEAESLAGSTEWGPTANRLKAPDDRVEGGRPGLQGGRGAAVDPVPGRAGHVLRRPRRDVQRA